MVAWRVKDTGVLVKTLKAPMERTGRSEGLIIAVCILDVQKKMFEIMFCNI